ncbi:MULTISPECIES: D-alanyl-D-alanine carboxypeptidase/D-alanyl-D-alanine endopeptidase [unclassified Agarivorans]|nr:MULTISPECIES: D-alanyl-D-alanine carboxypeptidase/D-alanyl-D-alanine-endopeptidase [unclassified Agarivorans]MDO6686465.1 D-alanyl-D-alanine carboxypeptidase/D-alanyl-D-alanine-endopeptidase [Agarivorans sp. 3_MG-2023]MDO6713767.1 D-alanyl-D-alanine carboxypeptidase/D-alanyl-D-alanine-endopeptidase [Agarivorans sp. 2_MG-2023]
MPINMPLFIKISFLWFCFFSLASQAALVSPPGTIVSYVGPNGSQNSQLLLTPASTLKVITATAAIKQLGADYRFNTQVSVKPNPEGLHLRLHMRGDPSFTSQDLKSLLAQVTKGFGKKVASITIDEGVFSGHTRSQGQVWNDIGICFASPVSALNIDSNCVNGNLKPGELGQLSKLHVSDTQLLSIDNQITTVSREHQDCEQSLIVGDNNQYQLKGCINQNARMMPLRFSINDEQQYFTLKLRRVLRQLGVTYQGKISYRTQLSEYDSTFSHRSVPLIDLVEFMLVESDNLTADSLFKTIAVEQQRAGSYQAASELVKQQLTELGLDLSYTALRDGSGLSRENLVSAELLYNLLELWLIDPDLTPLIYKLPVAGVSGTLKYRRSVTRPPLKAHIHAKSGYVNGVINLVGFIEKQGQMTPFVFMTNGVSLNEQQTKALRQRQIIHPVLGYERDWLKQQLAAIK